MAAVSITRQRVQDYEAFRRAFDSSEAMAMRTAGGVQATTVYRAEDEPNTIAIHLRFTSLAEAHAFSESAALRERRTVGGVEEAGRRTEYYEET